VLTTSPQMEAWMPTRRCALFASFAPTPRMTAPLSIRCGTKALRITAMMTMIELTMERLHSAGELVTWSYFNDNLCRAMFDMS
jgi:hypothetical protein